jgi:hypothetical protein
LEFQVDCCGGLTAYHSQPTTQCLSAAKRILAAIAITSRHLAIARQRRPMRPRCCGGFTPSRLILTGQAQTAGWTQATFKTQVCNNIVALFDCANELYVNVQNYSDFNSATATPPYNNGQLDTTKMQYTPGTAGSVVVVSLYYQWPIYVSLLSDNLSNQSGNNRLLVATSAFKNEPYQ